jgi:cell division protein FtsZ
MREMGKAMMGTGEAQGDKRALTAAEAAISNPLIDDASMKGAKGLLISITGGRDLTLYEVDEAATRIREEVDQDANIIVGATFDESLDGIIRVSVVATGIDQASAQRLAPAAAEARIAELATWLRADNPRPAERVERPEPVQPAPPHPVTHVRSLASAPAAAPAPASVNSSIESAAKAAIASATEDVNIRPLSLKPSLFIDPATSAEEPPHEPKEFVPPPPERLPARGPRMPRIDELPMPAQNEILAKRGELAQEEHPGRRKSFLERIASVGLGRREPGKDDEVPLPRIPQAAAPAADRLPGRPMTPRSAEPRPDPVSEYAKRPAPQGLDQHGRQTLVHNSEEQDHLEIPAFLRRQAH